MKRLGVLMLAMAILMLFGCETAVPEEIAAAPAYDIQAQLEKAEQLFLEGNYEEVILTLDTVLEIEPANVQGYLRLSDAYIARGESYKALELLKRGLEVTGDEQIAARIQGMTEEIDGIVDVALGMESTFMVDEAGYVYWCGQYQPSYDYVEKAVPTRIEGLPPVKEVYANCYRGDTGNVAITEDGDLYAWGLSAGSVIGEPEMYEPFKLWEGVKKAVLWEEFCLVLKEDGGVYSRGNNSNGILGTGDEFYEEYLDPNDVRLCSLEENYENYDEWLFVMDDVRDVKCKEVCYHSFNDVFQLDSGTGKVCLAITDNNDLYIWGYFGLEQREGSIYKRVYNQPVLLGTGVQDADVTFGGTLFLVSVTGELQYLSLEKALDGAEPILMPVPGKVASISCGSSHICVLDTDGILYTSGSNHSGQLGAGEDEKGTYQKMFTPLGDIHVRKTVAGDTHTCAILEDGRLLSWGNNEHGQLGNGRMSSQHALREPLKILEQVEAVFSSQTYRGVCSALMQDGTLFQAGEENGNVFAPVANNVKMASEEMMITTSGELKEIGANETLAQGATYVTSGTVYGDIDDRTLFYIDEDGALWGRSINASGELGIGSRNASSIHPAAVENMTEGFVFIMDGVKKCVVSGIFGTYIDDMGIEGRMTLILMENGDVYHCGADPATFEFNLTPKKIASGMIDMAISGSEAWLIGEDRSLYIWGDYIRNLSSPPPQKIFDGVQKICGNSVEGLLLDLEGNVYVIGRFAIINMLGLDRQTDLSAADISAELGILEGELNRIQIELPNRAKDIAICGGDALSYFAVLENGDLYVWGDNQYGQLGLGDAGSDETVFEVKLPA